MNTVLLIYLVLSYFVIFSTTCYISTDKIGVVEKEDMIILILLNLFAPITLLLIFYFSIPDIKDKVFEKIKENKIKELEKKLTNKK